MKNTLTPRIEPIISDERDAQQTNRVCSQDGWETGGRAPAESKDQLKTYLKCKGLICPLGGTISEKCFECGCTRCWCCFDECFHCIDDFLISDDGTKDERYSQIEEWFRAFNCWPLPLVTICAAVIEIVYFTQLYATENMNDSLLKSPLIWKATHRKDFWRWFTYSFCHGSILHLVLNLICKILLGIFVEFEHKWVRTLIIYVLGSNWRPFSLRS